MYKEDCLVINATRKVHLKIDAKDVENGERKIAGNCAAAQACMRKFKNATEARVQKSVTYIKIKDTWKRYKTSDALRTELITFDRGGTFEPGLYELQPLPPNERKRYGAKQGSKEKIPRVITGKKRTPHIVTGVRQKAPGLTRKPKQASM